MRRLSLLLVGLLGAAPLAAQSTRAERSGYKETSTYADVLSFLDTLQAKRAGVRVWTLGKTHEGRALPVVLASRPLVSGADEARASGKPIVYVQANIHAGEVEGKEAAQMLLRDLTLGPLRPLLDSVVLLVVPIYNADGNEKWAAGDVNRPGQNGPSFVGRRSNGQDLDLNRDYIKLEAPESRAAAELISRWNPHLFIDLHTTNGHGMPEVDVPLREESVPIHGIKVRFTGINANRFHLQPEGTELKATNDGDTQVIEVPPLAIHSMLVAETR